MPPSSRYNIVSDITQTADTPIVSTDLADLAADLAAVMAKHGLEPLPIASPVPLGCEVLVSPGLRVISQYPIEGSMVVRIVGLGRQI